LLLDLAQAPPDCVGMPMPAAYELPSATYLEPAAMLGAGLVVGVGLDELEEHAAAKIVNPTSAATTELRAVFTVRLLWCAADGVGPVLITKAGTELLAPA
jgi:hypothetical protein